MCYHYMRPEFLPAARSLGYGGMTIPMFPFRIEPQPGKYVFTYSDKLLETAEKLGMKAHGHFSLPGYPVWSLPEWQKKQLPQMMKTGYTEEYFRQIRNFVRATVRHYGRRIRSWSQTGEINLLLRHSPYYENRYLRVLQIIHSEVKEYDPELLVISLSTSEVGHPNYAYLKHILPKALPYLDVVGPDWYNNPWVFGPGYRPLSEEKAGFREQILDVRKLAKGKMLSIEEKGYGYAASMPFDHPALKENAAVAQRGQIIAKGLGLLHWIPHYGISQKEGKTFDMGMWLKNNPRPILAATAAIARLLANAHDAVEIHPSPVIWGYVFKKCGRAIAAIWQSSSKPVVETNLTLPADAVCYDIMGNPCSFEGKISNYPIFVESSEAQAQLAERIRKSSFRLPQYAAECQFASDSEIRLVIRNLTGKELKLDVSHPHSEAQTVSIPADSPLKTVRFPLKKTIRTGCRSDFTLVCNGEKRVIPAVLNASPVIRLKNVKLDGTLGSFAGIEPIVMDHSGFLFPYDAAPNGLWTGKKDLSAKIYLGYDEKNLYIGAEVTDDQWFFTQTGSMLWNQDAIEISVDPLNNALSDEIKTRGYDADDLDFSYGQSAKGPEAWCFVHPDKAKLGNRSDLAPVIRRKDDETMILEFAIPWEEMGIKPEKGRIFGFNLGVFDRESATGVTSYSMALSAGTTNGKDPSCYRKFILSGD